ncbi:hypothetical protein DM860_018155 [Cuscuta australis]|uniref:HMA domain-containing protein n=1 Tax=Cuscuta australis TaxID=267555 RepID=A0A328E0V3_9ASTE|nr:hypothetical protein DM860_018155 [Cuscuta australis]
MGKQKAVISVILKDEKARTKAFKIAVCQPGVVAASIQVEKGQIEVVGEFDAVVLATTLRKKLGHADLLTVAPVVEKKDEAPKANKPADAAKEEPPKTQTVTISNPLTYYPPPSNTTLYPPYPVPHYYNEDAGCTVM